MEFLGLIFSVFIVCYILNVEIFGLAFIAGVITEQVDPTPNNIALFLLLSLAVGMITTFLRQSAE